MSGSSIKIRAELDESRGQASVRLLIGHPMLPERIDKKSGQPAPAHHIEEIVIALNGETVLVIDCGSGVSANPFFSFGLTAVRRGDVLSVRWHDNQQQSDSAETTIR
jgi:thiosulfate oxidation carrier complex protein SoxZ